MYMLIRYPGGVIVEGVLLAKGRDRLRVAASGFPETIELRRAGGRWFTDDGEQVEFDFLTSDRYQTPVDNLLSSVRCQGGLRMIEAVSLQ